MWCHVSGQCSTLDDIFVTLLGHASSIAKLMSRPLTNDMMIWLWFWNPSDWQIQVSRLSVDICFENLLIFRQTVQTVFLWISTYLHLFLTIHPRKYTLSCPKNGKDDITFFLNHNLFKQLLSTHNKYLNKFDFPLTIAESVKIFGYYRKYIHI